MTRATWISCAAAALSIASFWYLAVAHHPDRSSKPSPPGGSEQGQPRAAATTGGPRAALPSDRTPPTESGAVTGLPPASEEEQAARELAREPIEAQPFDAQKRHHEAWAEALLRSRTRQRESLDQLEAERASVDPALRPALEEAIRVRQKLLQERERQGEFAVSNMHSAP